MFIDVLKGFVILEKKKKLFVSVHITTPKSHSHSLLFTTNKVAPWWLNDTFHLLPHVLLHSIHRQDVGNIYLLFLI